MLLHYNYKINKRMRAHVVLFTHLLIKAKYFHNKVTSMTVFLQVMTNTKYLNSFIRAHSHLAFCGLFSHFKKIRSSPKTQIGQTNAF
jgi:hypothetical protein